MIEVTEKQLFQIKDMLKMWKMERKYVDVAVFLTAYGFE